MKLGIKRQKTYQTNGNPKKNIEHGLDGAIETNEKENGEADGADGGDAIGVPASVGGRCVPDWN